MSRLLGARLPRVAADDFTPPTAHVVGERAPELGAEGGVEDEVDGGVEHHEQVGEAEREVDGGRAAAAALGDEVHQRLRQLADEEDKHDNDQHDGDARLLAVVRVVVAGRLRQLAALAEGASHRAQQEDVEDEEERERQEGEGRLVDGHVGALEGGAGSERRLAPLGAAARAHHGRELEEAGGGDDDGEQRHAADGVAGAARRAQPSAQQRVPDGDVALDGEGEREQDGRVAARVADRLHVQHGGVERLWEAQRERAGRQQVHQVAHGQRRQVVVRRRLHPAARQHGDRQRVADGAECRHGRHEDAQHDPLGGDPGGGRAGRRTRRHVDAGRVQQVRGGRRVEHGGRERQHCWSRVQGHCRRGPLQADRWAGLPIPVSWHG